MLYKIKPLVWVSKTETNIVSLSQAMTPFGEVFIEAIGDKYYVTLPRLLLPKFDLISFHRSLDSAKRYIEGKYTSKMIEGLSDVSGKVLHWQ